jgi:hypothetical protein
VSLVIPDEFLQTAHISEADLKSEPEEAQLTQTEVLQRIEQRRTFSPAQHHLPDTLALLQDDRSR